MPILRLTVPELNHITSLLQQNEDEGSYAGPYAQYWSRHNRILAKIKEAFERDAEEKTALQT